MTILNGTWPSFTEQANYMELTQDRIRSARLAMTLRPHLFTDQPHPYVPNKTLRDWCLACFARFGGHIGELKATALVENALEG